MGYVGKEKCIGKSKIIELDDSEVIEQKGDFIILKNIDDKPLFLYYHNKRYFVDFDSSTKETITYKKIEVPI
jgi:hypothetical protein